MKASPFKRAIAMMQMISAAMAGGASMASIIAGLPEYQSRGHGLGKHTGKKWGPRSSGHGLGKHTGKKWGPRSSGHGLGKHTGKKWGPRSSGKYVGVFNGKRECERRMRQMARDAAAA